MPVTPPAGAVRSGTGSDAIAYLYSGGRVDLWNAVDGTTRTIQMPPGLSRLTEYGDLAVGYRSVPDENGTAWREMHLLIPETDGTTRDVPVTGLPEGVNLGSALGGDADGLLFQATRDGQYLSVMVDRRTGQVLSWTPPRAKVYLKARVTTDHVVLFNLNDATVLVFPRSDLSATPVEVTLGGSGSVNPAQDLAIVGDWLIHRPSGGTAVLAKPLSGGPEVTLLTSSNPGASAVPDGTAVVVGRTGADDWGIQRIVPGADGSPVVTQLKALPKPPFPIQGLSLDQGRLVTTDYGTSSGTNGERIQPHSHRCRHRCPHLRRLLPVPRSGLDRRHQRLPGRRPGLRLAARHGRRTDRLGGALLDGRPDQSRRPWLDLDTECPGRRADHRRLGPVPDLHDRHPADRLPDR
ncbi:hypothetical protein [Streptomyces sp. NPDC002758]